MAIDIELAGLKAAGTYRFETDLTSSKNVDGLSSSTYSSLRLIVGFSKKGPFNSVQLIKNSSDFIKMYGNIDRSLEKRGSYFHRSALVALSAGPILCMNILSLNPDRDQVMHRSLSVNVNKKNKHICTIPYQTVYDTDKFWSLSPESYIDSVHKFDNDQKYGLNNILNITNISNKPLSVLVKKATGKNTNGYDITLNEWFGEENVPEYLNGTSFISDYMVEVYVVSGNFGPQLLEGKTKEISSTNKDDNDLTSTTMTPTTYYEYEDVFEYDSDLKMANPYNRFSSDVKYQEYFDKYGFKSDKLKKFLNLPSTNVIATYVGSLIPHFTTKLNTSLWIEDIINRDSLYTGLLCSVDTDLIESYNEIDGVVNESIDILGHNFYMNLNPSELNFLSYALSQERIDKFDSLNYIGNIDVHNKSTNQWYIDTNGTDSSTLNYDAENEVICTMKDYVDKNIKVGDLILSSVNISKQVDLSFSRLTRVIEIKPLYKKDDSSNTYVTDKEHIRVICSDSIYVTENEDKSGGYITKYTPIDNLCDRYHWTYLGGFKVSDESIPDGTNERQNEILNMISENNTQSNLYKALVDRDNIQWRYVVDTFGLGVESECKSVYALLCKGRQSGLAIVNAPSMKDFKKSLNPSFVDDLGSVKSEYISTGGNLDKAPSTLFTLPKEENGASWAAYYYPYLKISDLASIKTVPPAAYVSNLYVKKYSSNNPWSIVAGPKRGVISGNQVVGLECSLINYDREFLEPIGINSIIWESGVGVEIFANKTAKQTPVSALSSIHAREACIYIQDMVESILKKYNWEANTARNREEIKTLVDSFLGNMKQNDGIYDFKTVMDTTNNTTEIIDKNMGVIDIYIEVIKGLEILAQRLTVLKTGSIESGNFE